MKKLALLALAGITIASCKTEPAKDYMVFSGKIDNFNKKEIRVSTPSRKLIKKITLNEDGSFIDTLKIETGVYTLSDGKKSINLYLKSNDDLKVSYDSKDTTNIIAFQGSTEKENMYLKAKAKIVSEKLGGTKDLYSLTENEFLTKSDAVKTELKKLAKESKLDSDFTDIEVKNIDYKYLYNLSNYESYHTYFSKNKDFKVSDSFPFDIKTLDIQNANDYKNILPYRQLVSSYFSGLTQDKIKDSNEDYNLTYMSFVNDSITNQDIKNSLLYSNARYGITYTENLKDFYKTYMNSVTDEENKKEITKTYNKLKVTAKGQPSPKFVNYENFKGGTTSLDDLKGKFVYVDVWATWCGPCKKEIPFLKKIEKQYHGKNIEFVSMSVDSKKDHGAWKKMVADKELGGIQLFADKSWDSKFVKDYVIQGIPRFILINPEGNIVTANAPRPSSEKLTKLFDELKI